MFCSSCGTSNREGAKFCHRCGSVLFRDERLRQLDLCFVMDATGSLSLKDGPMTLEAMESKIRLISATRVVCAAAAVQ